MGRSPRITQAGEGPLYQGRLKSFPVQEDARFLTVCRYLEGNALRAKLVARAERWRWCRLLARRNRPSALHVWLHPRPVDRPRNWVTDVNAAMDEQNQQDDRKTFLTPFFGTFFRLRLWLTNHLQ